MANEFKVKNGLIVGGDSTFSGNITIPQTAATTDTDKFAVLDNGIIKFRTGAQVLSDIGAQVTGSYDNYVSWTLQAQNSAGASLGTSPITSGDTAIFKAGTNVTLAWADDSITINSTDQFTGTITGTGENNQVAIWNGTTTQYSSANLTFNGTTLTIGGNINTGQGATEVHLMDQNIRTTDAVTFTTVNTGQGATEVHLMNQNVRTTDAVTFSNVLATGFVGNNTKPTRDKLRVWNDSTYTMGFKSGYSFGHLGEGSTDYAMSFQMSNTDARGFWWGDSAHTDAQGAMSLTTTGKANIAKSLSIGEGESITSPSTTPLYVQGSGSIILDIQGSQGQLFSVTDDLTGDIFTVSDISGIPILNVNADGTTTQDGNLIVSGSVEVTGNVIAPSFTGSLQGNANSATQVSIVDASADTTTFVVLAGDATGVQTLESDAGLTYNASSNALSATTFVGTLSGTANQTAQSVTFNNVGAGEVSGTTFNGSTARTISYNTIGAQAAGSYDNYVSWTLQAQNSAGASLGTSPITSGDTAIFKAGTNVTLAWADDSITINSTDQFTGTVTGTGENNRLAIWNGNAAIDSDSDFYVDGDTIFTTNLEASGLVSALGGNSTQWNTAYTDRLKWDGGVTGLVAATGRASLGGTTIGSNMFTLINPSAITFPRFNANNTVSALNAADFRTAIGAGTSSSSGVTSVIAGTGLTGGGTSGAVTLNVAASTYTPFNDIRSLGTNAFTNGANSVITTAQVMAEIEADGGFDSYSSVFKTSWSYAGNYNLTDAGYFTETAGSSWLTWTDNSSDSTRGNITTLAIAPNTGGSAGGVFIYNDQGAGYSPGWRQVWTSTTDGAGSGLDADKLDGLEGSAYYLDSNPDSFTSNVGTVTGTGTTNYLPKFTGTTALGNSLVYDNGTNVGIGTTSPFGKLDVAGNIRLQSANRIYFGGTGSIPYWNVGVQNTTTNNFEIGGQSYYSGVRHILLNPVNNGKVGIGTTSPNAKLEIKGTGTGDNTPQLIIESGGTDNNSIIHFTDDGGGQVNAIGALEGNMLTFAGSTSLIFKTNTGSILGNTNTRLTINSSGAVFTLPVAGSSFVKTGGTSTQFLKADGSTDARTFLVNESVLYHEHIALSNETTDLTTGTSKVTFRAPRSILVTGFRISCNTAPTGSTIIVDVNKGGVSMLSTKLSIDVSEKTSVTASSQSVLITASAANAVDDDVEITIDIDQVGSTIAGKGLKLIMYYTLDPLL